MFRTIRTAKSTPKVFVGAFIALFLAIVIVSFFAKIPDYKSEALRLRGRVAQEQASRREAENKLRQAQTTVPSKLAVIKRTTSTSVAKSKPRSKPNTTTTTTTTLPPRQPIVTTPTAPTVPTTSCFVHLLCPTKG